MTKDVIELAREACGAGAEDPLQDGGMLMLSIGEMQRFAALVAARERERVALHIASGPAPMCRYGNRVEIGDAARQAYAVAIRALNTEGEGHDR